MGKRLSWSKVTAGQGEAADSERRSSARSSGGDGVPGLKCQATRRMTAFGFAGTSREEAPPQSPQNETTKKWNEAEKARGDVVVPQTAADSPHRCIIEPNRAWKVKWDLWMAALIMYSIIIVPFRVGFGVKICLFTGAWVFDVFADLCFVTDICLTFRTAIVLDAGEKSVHAVERNPRALAIRYLRGWFWIDLASTVPVDTIIDLVLYAKNGHSEECAELGLTNTTTTGAVTSSSGGNGTAAIRMLRVLRLVRLLKLFRFLKLGRFIRKWEDEVNINPAIFRFSTLLVKIFFLAHLVGCAWFGVYTFVEDPDRNWVFSYADNQFAAEKRDAVLNDQLTQYLMAMYWSFTTMTTVGYGDIIPKNVTETLFVLVMEMVGIVVFGMVIGSITHIASNFNLKRKIAKERMQVVNGYVRERGLHKQLQRRIRRFYEYYFERVSVFDIESMLEEVSTSLKNDL